MGEREGGREREGVEGERTKTEMKLSIFAQGNFRSRPFGFVSLSFSIVADLNCSPLLIKYQVLASPNPVSDC